METSSQVTTTSPAMTQSPAVQHHRLHLPRTPWEGPNRQHLTLKGLMVLRHDPQAQNPADSPHK